MKYTMEELDKMSITELLEVVEESIKREGQKPLVKIASLCRGRKQ